MSKYLFHVLIGLDAAFPLHLSWLQLEGAEMTFHVHILDTHCSRALSNSNRQEGGKGNPVLPLPCTFYLTPNLLLNEPVTEVCRAVPGLGGSFSHKAAAGWWETYGLQSRRCTDFSRNRIGETLAEEPGCLSVITLCSWCLAESCRNYSKLRLWGNTLSGDLF